MANSAQAPGAVLGWLGFAAGTAALILAFVVFWAGPFAPQQPAGVTLGELAADIAKSAARSVAGQPRPEPAAPDRGIDDYLDTGIAVLAGLAIALGVAALVRHERRRAALSGIALGGVTVAFQIFTWSIMMIVAGLVIVGIMAALRDVFGDIFGGLLGE